MDEKAELEAFRAEKKRNEAIDAIAKERSAMCFGAIAPEQLREIAARQYDHDARLAAQAAPPAVAAPPVKPTEPAKASQASK